MEAIGHVVTTRQVVEDDYWGGLESRIELAETMEDDALLGLETFSHAEVIYCFDRVAPDTVIRGARHPRNNPAWPLTGILAQRAKNRPNRIGVTIVRILGREGRTLRVAELDAVHGTPVLDIKPVMTEFLPRGPVTQPAWSHELMRDYWHHPH